MSSKATLAFGAVALGLCSAPIQAATQDIVSIGATSLSISTTGIDFFSLGGAGAFDIGSASTGAFAALGGTAGTLQSITVGSGSISNFLTIPTLPQAQFTLTSIAPGVFSSAVCGAAPVPGQTCSPVGSPFNLVNTLNGATASFSAFGTVRNISTGTQSTFTATFSTEFTGQTYQSVLTQVASGALVKAPYSASINIPTGDFAGTLDIGQPSIAVSATTIDFSPTAVTIGSTSTGAFVPLSGTAATFHNLTAGSGSVPNFLTIPSLPQAEFTLTAVLPGLFSSAVCGAAAAPGQTCSPVGSPFNLVNTPTGAFMWFSADGTAMDTNTLQQTLFEGNFVTEFAGLSYQSLLATMASGGAINASYSVEIAAGPFGPTSAPEPATLALLGVGIAGLAASRRRKLT